MIPTQDILNQIDSIFNSIYSDATILERFSKPDFEPISQEDLTAYFSDTEVQYILKNNSQSLVQNLHNLREELQLLKKTLNEDAIAKLNNLL